MPRLVLLVPMGIQLVLLMRLVGVQHVLLGFSVQEEQLVILLLGNTRLTRLSLIQHDFKLFIISFLPFFLPFLYFLPFTFPCLPSYNLSPSLFLFPLPFLPSLTTVLKKNYFTLPFFFSSSPPSPPPISLSPPLFPSFPPCLSASFSKIYHIHLLTISLFKIIFFSAGLHALLDTTALKELKPSTNIHVQLGSIPENWVLKEKINVYCAI